MSQDRTTHRDLLSHENVLFREKSKSELFSMSGNVPGSLVAPENPVPGILTLEGL